MPIHMVWTKVTNTTFISGDTEILPDGDYFLKGVTIVNRSGAQMDIELHDSAGGATTDPHPIHLTIPDGETLNWPQDSAISIRLQNGLAMTSNQAASAGSGSKITVFGDARSPQS